MKEAVMDFDGQIALVTGAARGIGQAVANRLAGAGAIGRMCRRHPGG